MLFSCSVLGRTICLCFALINSVLLNLLCVWISVTEAMSRLQDWNISLCWTSCWSSKRFPFWRWCFPSRAATNIPFWTAWARIYTMQPRIPTSVCARFADRVDPGLFTCGQYFFVLNVFGCRMCGQCWPLAFVNLRVTHSTSWYRSPTHYGSCQK